MLEFFRTNQRLLGILLLGYAALLRVSWWLLASPTLPKQAGIGNSWISQAWLLDPAVNWCLGILALCIQAWIANNIIFHHRIGKNTDLLPGVGIVLFGSLLMAFLPFSAFSIANIALLLALRAQLKTYRTLSAAALIFNTGFFIGIASFFQPTYLCILPFIGLSMPLLRSGRFRDQTALLIGTFIPLFIVGFIYYWFDQFDFFWTQQWQDAFHLPVQWTIAGIPWIELIVMAGLVLFVLLQRSQYLKKTKMDVQTKLNIFYWYLLGLGISVLFAQPWHLYRWQAIVPIAGIFLGLSLSQSDRRVSEVWHLLLLLLLGFLHWWA